MSKIKNTDFNPCPICKRDLLYLKRSELLNCDKCGILYSSDNYLVDSMEKILEWWNGITPERIDNTWKKNFEIYQEMAFAEMHRLLKDDLFLQTLRDDLPSNIDIEKSMKKSFNRYWATEDGWKKKKRAKAKKIDWEKTIRNTIEYNRVFIPWDQQKQLNNNEPKPAFHNKKPDYE